MLVPKTKRQCQMIISNVLKACEDINELKRIGYDFLYLSSGFIAHYNIHGFKDYYEDPGSLRQDILDNKYNNSWDNFRPGEENYEYYHQKGKIYKRIVDILEEAQHK